MLVTFGQICNFRDLSLVTFYFYELTHFFRYNEEHVTFHLHYKHQKSILVTLLKMRPHYSQSNRENATPFSGTSPLASYNLRKFQPGLINCNAL